MTLPEITPVRQQLSRDHIADVRGHVCAGLRRLPLSASIRPGMQVAIGLGSRGISCICEVAAAVIEEVRACGGRPFLVPAMGSHGGGTAEGQRSVLEAYGLGETQLGAPIRSSMDVVQIGVSAQGMPIYFDAHAAQADAILLVNRVKPHTAFRGRWESGLFKMLAVGFSKEQGAATLHSWGIAGAIPDAARGIVAKLPVVAGVAIVENGFHQPAHIAVLAAAAIENAEQDLLQLAWQRLPRIPLEPLDLVVLGEIGKDISGTGMDLNVMGMWRRTGGPVAPQFHVIAGLDLTEASHGNAIGVGYCDLITQRLADKIDLDATYTNCLTAGNYNGAKLPITLPTDRAVLEAGLPPRNAQDARLVLVRNTLDLHTLWVSAALLPDVERSPVLTQIGPPRPIQFAADGSLMLDWSSP